MRRRLRSGVLLAGGPSSRFGSPKGLAPFAGGRLADRPLAALRAMSDEVIVAANDPDASAWFPDLRVVADEWSERSALTGLVTALTHARHDIVVVCAWDMPFVTAAILGAMAMTVELGTSCCVPEHANGALEPLCAAYDRVICTPAALQAQYFTDDGGAAKDVLEATHGTRWSIPDNLSARDAERMFSNVNTPADLERARQWLLQHPTA